MPDTAAGHLVASVATMIHARVIAMGHVRVRVVLHAIVCAMAGVRSVPRVLACTGHGMAAMGVSRVVHAATVHRSRLEHLRREGLDTLRPCARRDCIPDARQTLHEPALVEGSDHVRTGQGCDGVRSEREDGARAWHLRVDDGRGRPQPRGQVADDEQDRRVSRCGGRRYSGGTQIQAGRSREARIGDHKDGRGARHGASHEAAKMGRGSRARADHWRRIPLSLQP